jgi:hypothetical protein
VSTHDWHALAALGTDGGQALADGELLARGVHLLWSIRPELGFPVNGYQVWRRAHRRPEWPCFDFDDDILPPPGTLSWTWLGYRLEADPGPVERAEFACGKLTALHLPGRQTLSVHAASRSIATTPEVGALEFRVGGE